MICKRCGSNEVEIKSINPVLRLVYILCGICMLLLSGFNIFILILGFSFLFMGLTRLKVIHCKICNYKY